MFLSVFSLLYFAQECTLTILRLCPMVCRVILGSTKPMKPWQGDKVLLGKATKMFIIRNSGRFASNETEVRALVEGQLIAKRLHAETIGFKLTPDTRILVTGGASVNLAILQVSTSRGPLCPY